MSSETRSKGKGIQKRLGEVVWLIDAGIPADGVAEDDCPDRFTQIIMRELVCLGNDGRALFHRLLYRRDWRARRRS